MEYGEEIDIVIAGGGICGLATALALHRKGIKSLVLERSETLRATGGGITIKTNGWRALEQLGVASKLRQTALPFQRERDEWPHTNKQEATESLIGEARCLQRSDLVTALAESLPHGTIRFECQVLSVQPDPLTSYPLIQLNNGSIIKAKILIGCDGAHSVVADFLGLKPPKLFSLCEVRGLTCYPNGHGLPTEFVQFRGENFILGRIPMDDKLVYWFVSHQGYPPDSNISKDPEFIREFALESIKGFPEEMVDMVRRSDLEKLTLTHLRYRAPWDVLLGKFRKGTVTVAGDAMHVMGPFLGQGGSAALEDAVVLARCFAHKLHQVDLSAEGRQMRITQNVIGEAIDQFVKERRMRLLKLSLQAYLLGSQLQSSSSLAKFTITALMMILFKDPTAHTQYYCGDLYGYDPFGLSKKPEDFSKYQACELIHARWAMLGAAGFSIPEAFNKFGANCGPEAVWFKTGALLLDGNTLNYFGRNIPINLVVAVIAEVVLVGGAEYYRIINGLGLEDKLHPGGPFDPLGLAKDPNQAAILKVKEIKNGRLVMLAMLGFYFQAYVTGEGPVENLAKHVSDPFGNNLFAAIAGSAERAPAL